MGSRNRLVVDFQRNYIEFNGAKYCIKDDSTNKFHGESMKFGDLETPIYRYNDRVTHVFWRNDQLLKAVITIAGHFIKASNLTSIFQVLVSDNHPVIQIIDWIQIQNFGSTEDVKIDNFSLIDCQPEEKNEVAKRLYSDEFLQKITNNFTSLLQGFQVAPALLTSKSIDVNNIKIFYSYWVDLNHLIKMNCTSITLHSSTLSQTDLIGFLKAWEAGNNSKLMFLSVHFGEGFELDVGGIVHRLAHEFKLIDGNEENTFEIKGNDDLIAEIAIPEDGRSFKLFIA